MEKEVLASESSIVTIIKHKEAENPAFHFKASKDFYQIVGINRKRFAQLLRGEKDPTIKELVSVANFFNYNIKKLF